MATRTLGRLQGGCNRHSVRFTQEETRTLRRITVAARRQEIRVQVKFDGPKGGVTPMLSLERDAAQHEHTFRCGSKLWARWTEHALFVYVETADAGAVMIVTRQAGRPLEGIWTFVQHRPPIASTPPAVTPTPQVAVMS